MKPFVKFCNGVPLFSKVAKPLIPRSFDCTGIDI